MKVTLQITASASTLAAILAKLGEIAQPYELEGMSLPVSTPPLPAPTPTAPPTMEPAGTLAPPPLAPAAAPMNGDDSDDDQPNTNAPDVDTTGLPWDERIHAGTKAITGTGAWKKRRGVDAALITAVEAELRARAPVAAAPPPQPVAIPTIPMQPTAPIAPPVAAPQPLPPMPLTGEPAMIPAPLQAAVDQAHTAPPIPVAAAPQPGPSPSPEGLDFVGFMQHFGELTKRHDAAGAPLVHADYMADVTRRISEAYITAGRLTAPLGAITDIQNDPTMITYAAQLMQADGRW